MTYQDFSYEACFTAGNYRRYLTISQVGSRWFASKLNDNGFSSLLTITLYDADSHSELINKITGKVA
jgi:hypothetical protein